MKFLHLRETFSFYLMNKKFPFLMDDNVDPTRSQWCYASIVSSGGDMQSVYDSNRQIVFRSKPVPYLLALDGFDYDIDGPVNNPDDYYSFHYSLKSHDVPELQYNTQRKWRNWSVEGHKLFFNDILRVDFSDFEKNAKIHDIRIQLTSKEAEISHVYAGNRFIINHGEEELEYNFMFCIHADGTVFWERHFNKNEKSKKIISKSSPLSKKEIADEEPKGVILPFVASGSSNPHLPNIVKGGIGASCNSHLVIAYMKGNDKYYKRCGGIDSIPIYCVNEVGKKIRSLDVKLSPFSTTCFNLNESQLPNALNIEGEYDFRETLNKGKRIWGNWKLDNEWYYDDPRSDPDFDWDMEGRFIRGKGIINNEPPSYDPQLVLMYRDTVRVNFYKESNDLDWRYTKGEQGLFIIELKWGFAVIVKYEFDPPEDGWGGGEWYSPLVVIHERGHLFRNISVGTEFVYPSK
jgi:hypothetical protein